MVENCALPHLITTLPVVPFGKSLATLANLPFETDFIQPRSWSAVHFIGGTRSSLLGKLGFTLIF
jgi:hypothetical protein